MILKFVFERIVKWYKRSSCVAYFTEGQITLEVTCRDGKLTLALTLKLLTLANVMLADRHAPQNMPTTNPKQQQWRWHNKGGYWRNNTKELDLGVILVMMWWTKGKDCHPQMEEPQPVSLGQMVNTQTSTAIPLKSFVWNVCKGKFQPSNFDFQMLQLSCGTALQLKRSVTFMLNPLIKINAFILSDCDVCIWNFSEKWWCITGCQPTFCLKQLQDGQQSKAVGQKYTSHPSRLPLPPQLTGHRGEITFCPSLSSGFIVNYLACAFFPTHPTIPTISDMWESAVKKSNAFTDFF